MGDNKTWMFRSNVNETMYPFHLLQLSRWVCVCSSKINVFFLDLHTQGSNLIEFFFFLFLFGWLNLIRICCCCCFIFENFSNWIVYFHTQRTNGHLYNLVVVVIIMWLMFVIWIDWLIESSSSSSSWLELIMDH